MNVCALLGQVSKQTSGDELDRVKEGTMSILEELVHTHGPGQGKESMLGVAAKRVLDGWSSAQ